MSKICQTEKDCNTIFVVHMKKITKIGIGTDQFPMHKKQWFSVN